MKRVLYLCQLCNTSHAHISSHIKKIHKLSIKDYYNKVTNTAAPKCKYCSDECMFYSHNFSKLHYKEYCSNCSGRHNRDAQSEYYINNPDKLKQRNKKISISSKVIESNGNTVSHNSAIKRIITLKSTGKYSLIQSAKTHKLNEKLINEKLMYDGHLYYEYLLHNLLTELNINHLSGNNRYIIVQNKYDKSISSKSRYYLDFYLPDYNLCIECDGSFHKKLDDDKRDQFLLKYLNIKTIRLSNELISSMTRESLIEILIHNKIPIELLEVPKAELAT